MVLNNDKNNFIESLKFRTSNYADPYQAMNQYNSLIQLSSGIYTEEERFIYELLQNADDAAKGSKLRVRIDIDKNHFIFSHDGDPFDDVDVESICSVGDGGKSNDENKTGYKGIGFKSVFSHSKSVAIKTGDYFFKFSEQDWVDHWQSNWGAKAEWQKERSDKRKNTSVKMPWQIIPIPIKTNGLGINYDVISNYNVSTILFDIKSDNMIKRVIDLLKDSQILLFLRCKEVILDVFVSGKLSLSIKKLIGKDSVGLYNDNVLKSEWIVITKKINIPEEVIEDISKDDKTPPKLKGAKTCEISFAIQKEKNKLIETENALIFTFLPTSVSCGLPFVVNSNFITDSGRQQLQKECRWNLWIFNQMAYYYIDWIAELAKTGKTDKSLLSIIPDKLSFGELGSRFNDGLDKALEKIAFLPNSSGKLLKVKEAIYDKTKITELLSADLVIKYLNKKYDTVFTTDALIPEYTNSRKLKTLGVRIFGLDELDDFFRSEIFQSNHSLNENFKLIRFLHDYVQNLRSSEEKHEWEEKLKTISFIFDENKELRTPSEIYFPSVQFSNDFEDDIHFINDKVLKEVEKNVEIKEWFIKLGVCEPTDVSFIVKTIIGNRSFINKDNAIAVGKYLFMAHKKGLIDAQLYSGLTEINILTQNGTLMQAQECYLSDFYEPELKLEKVYDIDFYVSELYFSNKNLKSEWKTFFLKIGIKNDIEPSYQSIDFDYKEKWKDRFDILFIDKLWTAAKKYSWISYEGWTTENKGFGFSPSSIKFYGLPFLQYTNDYSFSKIYFSRVFNKLTPSEIKANESIWISGYTGMMGRSLSTELATQNCPIQYFKWIVDNLEIIPTVAGKLLKAKDVILNSTENLNICGKYLPIIDVNAEISDEWLEIIPIKRYLNLEDILKTLTCISNDSEHIFENKNRILSIYKILSTQYISKSKELSEWGRVNKLLSQQGEFIETNKLKYVTEKGFVSDDLIFTDPNNESPELIRLFELFGVTVIQEFKPEIVNPHPNPSLKIRLQEVLPYILLIAERKNDVNYSETYKELSEIIDRYEFVDTEEIILSYENKGELVHGGSVRSYLSSDSLYYKGRWNNPMTLYSLAPNISRLLDIEALNEEIKVILLSEFEDIKSFIVELGINITDAVSRKEFGMSVEKTKSYSTDEVSIDTSEDLLDCSDERSRINISNESKLKIFEELKAKGFVISGNLDINYTIVRGIKNPNGKPVTLVVKSGKKGSLYFNPEEWLALSGSDAQLFVVSRGNIVRNVTMEDLQKCNDTFHMRFNTRVFSVNTNLKAFATFFHYLKFTHFIFNTPENTNDYLQEFGLSERNKSAIDLTADDKKLLL